MTSLFVLHTVRPDRTFLTNCKSDCNYSFRPYSHCTVGLGILRNVWKYKSSKEAENMRCCFWTADSVGVLQIPIVKHRQKVGKRQYSVSRYLTTLCVIVWAYTTVSSVGRVLDFRLKFWTMRVQLPTLALRAITGKLITCCALRSTQPFIKGQRYLWNPDPPPPLERHWHSHRPIDQWV